LLISPADFARRELPAVEIDATDVPLVRNGGRCSADIPREAAVALIGPGEDLVAIVDASGASWSYLAVLPSLVGNGLAGKASRERKTEQADDQDDA